MSDFGFNGLIEKFEEHVGKRPTRFMLIVFGVCATVTAVGAALRVVAPLVMAIAPYMPLGTAVVTWRAVLTAVLLGVGVGLGSRLGDVLVLRRLLRRSDTLLSDINITSEELHSTLKTAETNATVSQLLLETICDIGEKSELLDPVATNEIRKILKETLDLDNDIVRKVIKKDESNGEQ